MAGNLNKAGPSPFIPLEEVDPRRFAFVSMVEFNKATPAVLAALVPQVTTYRQYSKLPGMDHSRVEEKAGALTLGDNWVYSHHQSAGAYHQFYFVQLRTEQEAETAIPALTYQTVDLYSWPDVLLGLRFIEDSSDTYEVVVGGAAQYKPKLVPRMATVPGGSYASKFLVEVFANHKPFDPSFFLLDTPVSTGVHWDTRGARGSFFGLHDEVVIPEGNAGGTQLFNVGMKNSKISWQNVNTFPKTNHTKWLDHVCHEHQQCINGIWMLERRTVFVPEGAGAAMKLVG